MPASDSQRLLVGFRDDDPRRYHMAPTPDKGGIRLGPCAQCHHEVYGDLGARDTLMRRDPVVVCMYCQDEFIHREHNHQSGIVVQT